MHSGLAGNSILDTITSGGMSLLGNSGTKLIFKSNVTPDIEINISDILSKKNTSTPIPETVTSSSPGALALIRPQITVRGLGLSKVIAPHGPPIKNAWILALIILAASGLIGARIAWGICKRVPPKKKKVALPKT